MTTKGEEVKNAQKSNHVVYGWPQKINEAVDRYLTFFNASHTKTMLTLVNDRIGLLPNRYRIYRFHPFYIIKPIFFICRVPFTAMTPPITTIWWYLPEYQPKIIAVQLKLSSSDYQHHRHIINFNHFSLGLASVLLTCFIFFCFWWSQYSSYL